MTHNLSHGRRRDWFSVLRALARVGISYAEVGRRCGRDPTTVRMWAEGGDPKESEARIVLALFAKHCPVEYVAHQKHYDIKVEIDNVTQQGENRSLPFVG